MISTLQDEVETIISHSPLSFTVPESCMYSVDLTGSRYRLESWDSLDFIYIPVDPSLNLYIRAGGLVVEVLN